MTMPGFAPPTPACHEPSLLDMPPSNAVVSSPKYQTVPSTSCAYQSYVSSTIWPPDFAMSRTTTQVTPITSFVSFVTVTVTVSSVSTTSYSQTVPGTSGKNGLSTPATK